jgi:hypothetical protein
MLGARAGAACVTSFFSEVLSRSLTLSTHNLATAVAACSSDMALQQNRYGTPPLMDSAAREAGVIGSLKLDANEGVTTISLMAAILPLCIRSDECVCCTYAVTHREACLSRDSFRVPFPCTCCGADCACCPHSPRGLAWEAALADGFGALLAEAGPLARSVKLGALDCRGVSQLNLARVTLLNSHWVPRANSLLLRHGVRVAAFSWSDRFSERGVGGWSTSTVLQFYDERVFQAWHGSAALTAGLSAGAAKE